MTITELNIHWIRHGYSCANIHKWIHATIHDPGLTYDGLECSLKSAKTRDKDCKLVRRKGRVYVINKKNPRMKARQG